jgi:hypothetical protein
MTGWNPAPGGGQDPPPGPQGGSGLGGRPPAPPPSGYQVPAPPQPPGRGRPPGRRRPRRSRAKWWIGLGAAALVVAVAIAVVIVTAGGGSGVPPGTPNGAQLQEILPTSAQLPSGWYLVFTPSGSTSFLPPGKLPPRPIAACLDFGQGFDLGAAGDTFVSSASETADFGAGPGDGFLRADAFGVEPGDASAAIKAISGWVTRCSSYSVQESGVDLHYTVTAAPVPGLGDQSLDVRVTQQPLSGSKAPATDNNTLLVRVGNDLIAIECIAPPGSLITSLASLAAPMVRKLPTAATLAVSQTGPKPAPVPSPGLTDRQLEALLPRSGLPAEYNSSSLSYSDQSNDIVGAVPYTRPPTPLSCSDLPKIEGTGLTNYDVNWLNLAQLTGYSPNSDALDVTIDETSNPGLAAQDLSTLQADASQCHRLRTDVATIIDVYAIKVTTVPGLGSQNVNVYFKPVSSNLGPFGAQDILMVRVGDALVMVDYSLPNPPGSSPGVTVPPVDAIARAIVARL